MKVVFKAELTAEENSQFDEFISLLQRLMADICQVPELDDLHEKISKVEDEIKDLWREFDEED